MSPRVKFTAGCAHTGRKEVTYRLTLRRGFVAVVTEYLHTNQMYDISWGDSYLISEPGMFERLDPVGTPVGPRQEPPVNPVFGNYRSLTGIWPSFDSFGTDLV